MAKSKAERLYKLIGEIEYVQNLYKFSYQDMYDFNQAKDYLNKIKERHE